MLTKRTTISARLERNYPAAIGVLTLILVLCFGPTCFRFASAHNLHLDQFYSGLFTLATVATGFLFAFYTFMLTTDRPFIRKAKSTIYFKRAQKYCLDAILIGACVCVLSIPYLVIQPAPSKMNISLVCVAFWVALIAWAFSTFERAARVFSAFASVSD